MPVYPEPGQCEAIELEACAVFQITRHAHDKAPSPAGGILLGMELDKKSHVTETFPLPASALSGDGQQLRSKKTVDYQRQMIEKLEAVGADSNVQGWYISSSLGAIYEQSFLEIMYHFQQQNNEAVMIVHDVAMSQNTGNLILKAFRLSPEYLAVKKKSRFSTESLEEHGLDFKNLIEELPVTVHNSHLVNLFSVQRQATPLFKQLRVPDRSLVENSIEDILDSVDDFNYDQNNYNYYQRQLVRENQKVNSWKQKRKAENEALVAQGKQPLSLDESKVLFKLPEEPSRLENLLVSAQLDQHCDQIQELSAISATNLMAPKYA